MQVPQAGSPAEVWLLGTSLAFRKEGCEHGPPVPGLTPGGAYWELSVASWVPWWSEGCQACDLSWILAPLAICPCTGAGWDHFVIFRGLVPDSLISCDLGDIPGILRPREGRNHFLEL